MPGTLGDSIYECCLFLLFSHTRKVASLSNFIWSNLVSKKQKFNRAQLYLLLKRFSCFSIGQRSLWSPGSICPPWQVRIQGCPLCARRPLWCSLCVQGLGLIIWGKRKARDIFTWISRRYLRLNIACLSHGHLLKLRSSSAVPVLINKRHCGLFLCSREKPWWHLRLSHLSQPVHCPV